MLKKHVEKGSCSYFEEKYLLSKIDSFSIPHFYIIWKILKNPPVGRPIVAGYNWILTPASIFVGHFLKDFYVKFDGILKDSISLVRILEKTKFEFGIFLFTVDFESLYTNIPVLDAIEMIKRLVFQYQYVILNAHFIIELLDIVLKNSLMTFDKEYFQQIFGIIMGTNLAPILANLYLAMLQEELKKKCVHDKKLKWPVLFQRFIDDGFGIIEGRKQDVEYWINQFNTLRKTIKIDKWSFGNHVEFMDLYIYKGDKFYESGFLDFKIHQKEINRYMYIPYKSGHVSHTSNNYVLGEIKRYIKYNSLKLTFLKIRTQFFSRLRNRGFKKVWLRKTFSTFQYEDRPKLMKKSHCPIPEFQLVPETEVENLMVRDSERILKESGKPRLNFNPSFTDGVNSERRGTEILVPQGP